MCCALGLLQKFGLWVLFYLLLWDCCVTSSVFSRGNDVESEKENIFRICWGGGETGRGASKARRAHKESRSRKDFL